MPPTEARKRVLSWASDIEPATLDQAEKAAGLPFVPSHIALMPDAHVGKGATVGSVIPTKGAVIPAAVGVDIGCGMIAVETDLTAEHLPDSLEPLHSRIAAAVPAGVGQGHVHLIQAWTSTRSWPTSATWSRWSTRSARSSTTRAPEPWSGS